MGGPRAKGSTKFLGPQQTASRCSGSTISNNALMPGSESTRLLGMFEVFAKRDKALILPIDSRTKS